MAKFNDLYWAVRARDCARLRQLVQGGIDVDTRDSKKRTVLHHAAQYNLGGYMKDVIQTLVDLGADINAGDLEGMTPLHYSIAAVLEKAPINNVMKQLTMQPFQEQIRDMVQVICMSATDFLVELGADINARCDLHVTSLHRAVQLNNIRAVETLLRLGVDVNANKLLNCTVLFLHFARDPKGTMLLKRLVELGADINSTFTWVKPLFQAVELGRMDIIKMLVQHGADVNTLKKDCTPVTYAVIIRRPDLVKTLAQLGADLNAEVSHSSIVNEIVKVGRVDILEYLVGHGIGILPHDHVEKLTALGLAVECDSHEIVDCLLKCGADVNVRYGGVHSALVTAMRLGNTDMVKALVKLEPLILDEIVYENKTALQDATCTCSDKDLRTMKLLIKYGGDVNLKYTSMFPAHYAVALGNGEMLRVLAELGADMNREKVEGASLIHDIIKLLTLNLPGKQDNMAVNMIKLLVEAGLDLNQCYNSSVRPLHDAVRLGDTNMVQVLGELKPIISPLKSEGETPVFQAAVAERTDLIRYFVKKGANVNSRMTFDITPLHDAVRLGNVDMIQVLINSGASQKTSKHICTVLHCAVNIGTNEVVKCFLECGADINAKASVNIRALHDAVAVENSDQMICALQGSGSLDEIEQREDEITPLYISIQEDHSDITETLLKHGADINCLQGIWKTPLDVALDQGKVGCAELLMSQNMLAYRDTIGSSPLQRACRYGHIDQARLLIIEGSDVTKQDCSGRMPLEYLQLAATADYHVLHEAAMAPKDKVAEQVSTSFVCTSGCHDMTTSLHTPGIGDVKYISSPSTTEISERVTKLLVSTAQQCKAFSGQQFKPIGSSSEGTRVGLPNEMDFLFGEQLAKDEERKVENLENGYAKYNYIEENLKRLQQTMESHNRHDLNKTFIGSVGFHEYFIDKLEVFVNLQNSVSDEKVSVHRKGSRLREIKHTDRKACSLLKLVWDDGESAFIIPVDIVPSLHIDNWPEGATTKTWLMDEQELRSRGYVLVPKPPHVKSDLAKECTEEELITLWKISFPHLETEHMQRLEQRVKDVYITAKCLRNPDVCRIMITDDGSLPRTVGKYITSYQLKMCFFKNVDYFRQHDELSLEKMVCKVYTELVVGLTKNFIPLFFLPNVSALSGIKVNVPKSLKVAKIMARFVRALYHRDSLGDITDGDDDQVMTVYQRNPSSVYRVYDISGDNVELEF